MRSVFFKLGFYLRSKLRDLSMRYRFSELSVIYPNLTINKNNAIFEEFPDLMIEGSSNNLELGKGCFFRGKSFFYLGDHANISIGKNTFLNRGCSLNAMERIEIGDDCLFGEGVKIYDHNHRFKSGSKLIRTQGYKAENVKIGANCWIGSNAVILKGVKIGNNCIVAAGVIVSESIPDNTLVRWDSKSIIQDPINFQ